MSNHSDVHSQFTRPLEGFDRFKFDIGHAITQRSLPYMSAPESGLLPALVNRIMDEPGPKRMVAPIPIADVQLYKILRAFLEIADSFESIRDAPKYLKHSPSKRVGIPHSRYMAWQVHGYLNEIYILQLRLQSFWSLLHKSYRNSVYAQSKQTKVQIDQVLAGFKSAVDIRGGHVHESRLQDPQIDRLGLIENMSSFPWPPEVLPYFKAMRGEIKRSWVRQMSTNEPQIKLALDAFSDLVHPILFHPDGRWIDP